MNSRTLFLAIARQICNINSGGYKGGMLQLDRWYKTTHTQGAWGLIVFLTFPEISFNLFL